MQWAGTVAPLPQRPSLDLQGTRTVALPYPTVGTIIEVVPPRPVTKQSSTSPEMLTELLMGYEAIGRNYLATWFTGGFDISGSWAKRYDEIAFVLPYELHATVKDISILAKVILL